MSMATCRKRQQLASSNPPLHRGIRAGRVPTGKGKKRASATISMSAFHSENDNLNMETKPSQLSDSIEDIASMLLDDTPAERPSKELGRQISQSRLARIDIEKRLTCLPSLVSASNGTSDLVRHPFSMILDPVHTADVDDADELDSSPSPLSRSACHRRKKSTQPLPRIFPKQQSERPGDKGKGLGFADYPHFEHISEVHTYRQPEPFGLDTSKIPSAIMSKRSREEVSRIKAMAIASKANKPAGSGITASEAPADENLARSGRVISKSEGVLDQRLQDSNDEARQHAAKIGHLVCGQNSLLPRNKWQMVTGAITVKMNEERNFQIPKIRNIFGHGNFKSTVSNGDEEHRWPAYDPFFDKFFISSSPGASTNPESRLQAKALTERSHNRVAQDRLQTHSFGDMLPQFAEQRLEDATICVNFDALFSSSPLDQSTPRIRLEPTFEEESSNKVKDVLLCESAGVGLTFQEQMDIGMPFLRKDGGGRVAPAARKAIGDRTAESDPYQKIQKYRLPLYEVLSVCREESRHYSQRQTPLVGIARERQERFPGPILESNGNNAHIQGRAGPSIRNSNLHTLDTPIDLQSTASQSASTIHLAARPRHVSKLSRVVGLDRTSKQRTEPHYLSRDFRLGFGNDSAFDIDELQWDGTAYDIGMTAV